MCSMIMLSFGEFDLIDQVPTNYPSSIMRRRCAYCYNCVNIISLSLSQSDYIQQPPQYKHQVFRVETEDLVIN